MSEEELYNYINEIQKYLRDITQDVSKKDTLNADIKNIKYLLNKIAMAFQIEKIDNKYNQEEASEEMIPREKINNKIKELEKEYNSCSREDTFKKAKLLYQINILKEILEED